MLKDLQCLVNLSLIKCKHLNRFKALMNSHELAHTNPIHVSFILVFFLLFFCRCMIHIVIPGVMLSRFTHMLSRLIFGWSTNFSIVSYRRILTKSTLNYPFEVKKIPINAQKNRMFTFGSSWFLVNSTASFHLSSTAFIRFKRFEALIYLGSSSV